VVLGVNVVIEWLESIIINNAHMNGKISTRQRRACACAPRRRRKQQALCSGQARRDQASSMANQRVSNNIAGIGIACAWTAWWRKISKWHNGISIIMATQRVALWTCVFPHEPRRITRGYEKLFSAAAIWRNVMCRLIEKAK
jgi:hypothetical protein